MAFDPNALLSVNDVAWKLAIAGINAQEDAHEASLDELEALVAALENAGGDLQAPIPNPVSARTIGPAVVSDTGWQDMGGVAHALHIQRKDAQATGALLMNSTVYVGCDTGDGNPTIGLMYTGIGTRYLTCKYRKDGAWADFQFNRGNVDAGRSLLIEDVLDFAFEKANSVFVVRLNGAAFEISAGAGTVATNFIAQAFPDGPGKFARYIQTGGTTPSLMQTTLAGGVISPLTARSIAFGPNGLPRFVFDYTGSPLGYLCRVRATSSTANPAWVSARLVENTVAGRATYEGPEKAPAAGIGYVYELIEAAADGSPKDGALPISATLIIPSPLRIGQNIVFDGNPYFTNLANNAGWQDRAGYQSADSGYRNPNQGYVGDDGNLTGFPVGTTYNLRCGKPAYGQNQKLHEISWVEPNNTTGTSRFTVLGETQAGKRWSSEQAIAYVSGRYVYRGIPNVNMDGDSPDELWAVFVGKTTGGQTQDIRVAEATADFTNRSRESWNTSMNDPLHGVIRTMESQSINKWWQAYPWSERPRPGYRAYSNAAMGLPLEDHIAMSRRNGRPLMFILGPKWPAEVVQKSVRALFTGEGMTDGLALRPDTHLYLSLVGNEHFNTNFTGLYEELAVAAERDYGYTAGGNNEKRIYSSVQIHNRNLDLVRAAIPEFMDRVTVIYSCSPGNHEFEWGKAKSFGIRGVQAIETSIYVGIGVKGTSYGSNTPGELLTPWLGDADAQVDRALLGFNNYAKEGVARLLYEVGMDIFGTIAMTADQYRAWVKSPEYMQVYRRAINRIRNEFGSEMALYYDNGNMGFWGHWNPGVATPKWDLMLETQAAVEAGQ